MNHEATGVSVILPIDPATLSTAQQKVMNFTTKRIITNPRVAKAMRVVSAFAKPYASDVRRAIDGSHGYRLSVCFSFAYPKSMLNTRAKRAAAIDGAPVLSARYGDLDNRAKAFIDALVKAGWMDDDHLIAEMWLRKEYTLRTPCICVLIAPADANRRKYNPRSDVNELS